MTIITKKKMVEVRKTFVCDKCNKHDEENFHTFSVNKTLGYDSVADMSTVSFELCDNCLLEISLCNIPGSRITYQGEKEDKAILLKRIYDSRK